MFAIDDANRSRAGSTMLSLAVHGGAAALLLTMAPAGAIHNMARRTAAVVTPLVEPYLPAAPKPAPERGGGGGGDGSVLPASQGRLPRVAPRQFTPPMAVTYNESPRLLIGPTIVASPDVSLPNVNMAVFGDPLGRHGPPSNGTGSGSGIGDGSGGGIGSGRGPGYGPGTGGGWGGGARGGVTAAVVLYQVEPEYSDEARKARVQGTVAVMIEIDEAGRVRNPTLRSTLGMGLDERALEAVRKWRFRPYLKDGKPVAGPALVELRFRLL